MRLKASGYRGQALGIGISTASGAARRAVGIR